MLPPTTPMNQPLTKGDQFVVDITSSQNSSTSIAIRKSSGEVYLGGFFNDNPAEFPVNSGNFVFNGASEFFVTKGNIQMNTNMLNQWPTPVNSASSHNAFYTLGSPLTTEFFGLCVNENLSCWGKGFGKTYITGSHINTLSSAQLGPGISFPPASFGGEACYIARVLDEFNQQKGVIKNQEAGNFEISPTELRYCDITLFPEPASDNLAIQINWDKPIYASIYSLTGAKILILPPHSNLNGNYTYDISSLKSGMYFLMLTDQESFITKKFIKK